MRNRNGTSWSGRYEGTLMTRRRGMACRYAGIDWATERHDVLVADDTGNEVSPARSPTTRTG